ncbi:nuclear transport factor 2 family protein [Parabacteroides sp. OttesenSCG-928-N08]|nr:nuclear transport factor 2 family protein [Parabacteroides sp. OttesenSCG-928-N08]
MDKQVVLAYIKAINEADVAKLYSLMSPEHVFIDAHDGRIIGRDAMKQSWVGYFEMFPDYLIEVNDIVGDSSSFAVFGYAGGTYKNLKNDDDSNYYRVPAAWKVILKDNLVTHWQVYADNTRAIEIYNRNNLISGRLRQAGQCPA